MLFGRGDREGVNKADLSSDTPDPHPDSLVPTQKLTLTHTFDCQAPTGHTLRLLTLPEFVNTSVGKILRIRQRIVGVAESVKGIFTGGNSNVDKTNERIEKFQQSTYRGEWGAQRSRQSHINPSDSFTLSIVLRSFARYDRG